MLMLIEAPERPFSATVMIHYKYRWSSVSGHGKLISTRQFLLY